MLLVLFIVHDMTIEVNNVNLIMHDVEVPKIVNKPMFVKKK